MINYALVMMGVVSISYVSRVLFVSDVLWFGLIGAWVVVIIVASLWAWQRMRYIALALVAICLVGWRASNHYQHRITMPESWIGVQVEVVGVVSDTPQLKRKSVQVFVDGVVGESDERYRLLATLPYHSDVEYGQKIQMSGVIQSLDEVADEGYRHWLQSQGVHGLMLWPDWQVGGLSPDNWFVYWGWRLQQALCLQIARILPSDEGAFLLGVVLGAELPLSEEFDQALRLTGTSHLIVASGYNISVLIALMFLLTRKWPRLTSYSLTLTSLVAYVFVSGTDPSIVRAAIMGSLVVLGMSLGRQRMAQWLLLLTAVIMLVIYPGWIDQLGFQLSYAATLGLLLFQEPIGRMLPQALPATLLESISSTLAAQLLVFPLIMESFGQISSISLIANTLILWLTPWIMLVGLVIVVGGAIFSFGAEWLAWGIYPWLWYIKQVILHLSRLPWSSIDVSAWPHLSLIYSSLLMVGLGMRRFVVAWARGWSRA